MRDSLLARIVRSPEGAIGSVALLAMLALALAAPWLAGDDPLAIAGRPLLSPGFHAHLPLGTDRLGRDIFSGLLFGARSTLTVAAAVMVTALAAGAAIGACAGYVGGWLDEMLMRLADAAQSVPSFMLALAIVSVAGPSQPVIVAALAASAWTGPARVVRAEVLSLRQRAFVEASRLSGRSTLAMIFEVILPNAVAPLLALAAIIVASAVIMEAALAFLGLTDPNVASWGAMIAEGRSVLRTAPHVILAPGVALAFVVLAVSLVSEGASKAMARGQT
ncbi:MAG: peptide ABC transporter permease [Rhizobiales bacterium 65-9]|nr:ABC transporter permease [Hyphomicrobiales bacterium]OJY35632.1 MAG: peptide ABC transporter permease [Rhizobiales bacterium 65-9]